MENLTLDLLVENENGQMEINFESLLLLTTEEFVQELKTTITKVARHGFTPIFKIIPHDVFLNIYICGPESNYVYTYFHRSKDFSLDFISSYDISVFQNMRGEK